MTIYGGNLQHFMLHRPASISVVRACIRSLMGWGKTKISFYVCATIVFTRVLLLEK